MGRSPPPLRELPAFNPYDFIVYLDGTRHPLSTAPIITPLDEEIERLEKMCRANEQFIEMALSEMRAVFERRDIELSTCSSKTLP